jgi:hypothetical protein
MSINPTSQGRPGASVWGNLRTGSGNGKGYTGEFCRFGSAGGPAGYAASVFDDLNEKEAAGEAASLGYLPLAIFFCAIIFRVNRSPSTVS